MGSGFVAGQSGARFEDAFPQARWLPASPASGRWAESVLFDGHLLCHPLGAVAWAPSAPERPSLCSVSSKTNGRKSLPVAMRSVFLATLLLKACWDLIHFIKAQPPCEIKSDLNRGVFKT